MIKLAIGGLLFLALSLSCARMGNAQSINSGTVTGVVTDPSGGVVHGARVLLRNPVTGYQQSVVSDDAGSYRINNIPQNNYQLTVTAPGFSAATQQVDIRSALPIAANISLKLAAGSTVVDVVENGAA